jgi:dTDP-4-amino-4,6-dideoxygalactose transaminase
MTLALPASNLVAAQTRTTAAAKRRPLAFADPVYVTKPMLPDLDQFKSQLAEIWQSGWLTNGGAKHRALEEALVAYLQSPHISLFNNGTIALIVACQALQLTGEVITTPFTFAATPHVLTWNNVAPVFADIRPDTMTLDPERIESLITPRTSAILGVHVYGMPCAVHDIEEIATAHGLKVIYDGAHAFGTRIDKRPITEFGDATMLSFHATKLFHTAEGGALVVRDPVLKRRVELLKNFGIKNEAEVFMPGINGKMNEIQAALGLLTLHSVDLERRVRAGLSTVYHERLSQIEGLTIFDIPSNVENSRQYFVVRIDSQRATVSRDAVYDRLKMFNIFARKYFHPLCSQYDCYRALPSASPANLPVAHRVSQEVLALPYYGALGVDGVHRVCDAIEYIMYG